MNLSDEKRLDQTVNDQQAISFEQEGVYEFALNERKRV